jgi:hypothetical protein
MAVRTWAPRGQTSLLRVKLTHDHLSAISGITLDGRLFMQVRPTSYDVAAVVGFFRVLLRKIKGKVLARHHMRRRRLGKEMTSRYSVEQYSQRASTSVDSRRVSFPLLGWMTWRPRRGFPRTRSATCAPPLKRNWGPSPKRSMAQEMHASTCIRLSSSGSGKRCSKPNVWR